MYNPQIKTFLLVAKNGSFAKAAEILYISPTAVMKQINALEERLEITLFSRTNHGLKLTDAGKSLLQDAEYLIDFSNRAISKARDIAGKNNEALRIGTSIMTPVKFILDIWYEIHKFNPHLKIELILFENNPVNSVEILKNLGNFIDIVAGLYDDRFLLERGCKAYHLYNKKLLFAVPITHKLSVKSSITVQDLQGETVLLIRKGWNEYIDMLREELMANNVKIEDFDMFNITAFNRAVKENIPILTVGGWEDVHPLLRIVYADWHYSIPFGILYSPNPSKQVEKFISALNKLKESKDK